MKRPKMIMFDYGHTLMYEPDWNAHRGNCELLKYAIKNPNNCSSADMQREIDCVFCEIAKVRQTLDYDIPCTTGERLAYGRLGLEFSLTPLEQEIVFRTAASPGAFMPNADIMLDYLNSQNIRTAVISNNDWSGQALKHTIDRLLPNNKIEFVVSSCEYMIRKPDKRLFEIALNKAGLDAEQVWYCGDKTEKDVCGAHYAGMFPVLYQYQGVIPGGIPRRSDMDIPTVDFEYLRLNDWCQLIDILENIK